MTDYKDRVSGCATDIDWSKAPSITHEDARLRFNYDHVTGVITHKDHFHKSKNGKRAISTKSANGYLTGTINGRHVKAHRFAFFWMTGKWPREIDHFDGVKSNNAWANLREVSSADNQKNRPIPRNCKTGLMGVWFRASRAKPFVASWADGKRKVTKQYATLLDAACARKSMEIKFGYSENHGRILCA